jgi:two-component system cell cycle sensor histidine kinase/response regulator CckA
MNRVAKRCRVLIVDGNWMFREAARYALARAGYDALQAETPNAAVALMEQEAGRVDLVVSEVQFKGATQGLSLLEKLRTFNADLKAVFVSGYPDDEAKMQQVGHVYLCKPFEQREFLAVVDQQLVCRSP